MQVGILYREHNEEWLIGEIRYVQFDRMVLDQAYIEPLGSSELDIGTYST